MDKNYVDGVVGRSPSNVMNAAMMCINCYDPERHLENVAITKN